MKLFTHVWMVHGDEFAYYEGIHGCDGCCVGAYLGNMRVTVSEDESRT
jgi:hypothetical protein